MRLLAGLCLLIAQPGADWRDPSPHTTRFVTVDSSVRLEVLDWGGAGRPILFVGCYLTAHVYDDIAPKLTDQFHVFAVTRRGVGASDPSSLAVSTQEKALQFRMACGIALPSVTLTTKTAPLPS